MIDGEPVLNAVCHCDDCKRRTGLAFGWSVYYRDRHVGAPQGEFTEYNVKCETPQKRWFCRSCGSTLMWKSATFPHMTGIAGGSVTQPELTMPDITIRNEGRCPWVTLPEDWWQSLDHLRREM